uniref:Uncharacterized protein n=1 Tax=Coptotermes formosanus TaxID=36987 RepID=R4V426_COPFO|nr:hypothetical protein [Coptotermes formosanus]
MRYTLECHVSFQASEVVHLKTLFLWDILLYLWVLFPRIFGPCKGLIFKGGWSSEEAGPVTLEEEAITCSQNTKQLTPNGRAQYPRRMEFSLTCVMCLITNSNVIMISSCLKGCSKNRYLVVNIT